MLLLLSPILLFLGFKLYNKNQRLLKRGLKAEAVIIKNTFKPSKQERRYGGTYHPVVRFLTDRNIETTHELTVGYSTAKPEGTKVEVLYDPSDPSVVEVNAHLRLVVLPRVLIGIGVVVLLIGVGSLIFS